MEKGMGLALKADLLNYLKAATMQQAYEMLIKHGIDTLGPLIISEELQESLALVYTDKTWQQGEEVTYYFNRTDAAGTQEKIYSELLDGTLPIYTSTSDLFKYNVFEDNESETRSYEMLKKHEISTLGPVMIAEVRQESLAFVYTDKTGQTCEEVTYYFNRTDAASTQENIYSELLDGTLPIYTSKFDLLKYNVFEDNASATWGTEMQAEEQVPLYVQLYAAQEGDEDFILVDSIFTNQLSPDSVTVFYAKETVPDSHIAWYIRAVDRAGNLGVPSDTLNAINFDRNQIAPIENLRVTDTL